MVTIVDALGFDAFLTVGDRVVRLDSGESLCITADANDFSIAHVNISSLELVYGSLSIPAAGDETSLGGDRDQDGREELLACFTKDNLRRLLAGLPSGTSEITVALRGQHQAGYPISGNVELTVGSPSLSVSPNPMHRDGTISFTKSSAGVTRIHLHDVSGRLVRTILDSELGAGLQSIPLEARDRSGSRLAAGVYFLRISDQAGVRSRSVVITR